MKYFATKLLTAALFAAASGCATDSTIHSVDPGPLATCHVCRYNNDLACVRVRVKEGTPSCLCDGQTYHFCSDDCRAAFEKNPTKYVPQAR